MLYNKLSKIIHNNSRKINSIMSMLILAFLYFYDLYFMWTNGLNVVNSDSASEMILSMQLNKEGKILPLTRNWFYSTELRVLNTQIIYRIALALSPNNWHLAKTISVGIFLIILIVCAIWLMRKMGYADYAFWLACAVISPFGFWYGQNVIFNSYYVPHIAISMASFALLFSSIKIINKRHKIFRIAVLLLLGFIAGCGGIRQLMVCYVPLLFASIILFYLRKGSNKTREFFCLTSSLFAASCAGYLMNNKVLSQFFHFSNHSETMWGEFDLGKVIECIGDFIHLFGWHENVNLFSFKGMGNVFGILLVFITLCAIIYLLKNLKQLDMYECLIVLFFVFAFLIQLLVFSAAGPYNESYWVPTAPFVFIISLIALKHAKDLIQKSSILIIFTFMILLCSNANFSNPYNPTVPNSITLQNIAEWLTESGYTQGYATFWNGNILTELSDGKIEMWTIGESNYIDLDCIKWLQTAAHIENPPDGPCFLLLHKTYELERNINLADALSSHLVYGDDNFMIYSFDDISQYWSLIN